MKRDTQQREAIRRTVLTAERPLAVAEILELAQREVPGLGIATVYRNVRALREEGLIVEIDYPGQRPRWEGAGKCHHHHFLCLTCDRLFEIPNCPKGLSRLLPVGFELDGHDILLRGKCDACSSRPKD